MRHYKLELNVQGENKAELRVDSMYETTNTPQNFNTQMQKLKKSGHTLVSHTIIKKDFQELAIFNLNRNVD